MKKAALILFCFFLIVIYQKTQAQTPTNPITCVSGSVSNCTSYPIYVQQGTPTEYNFSNWDWTDQNPCNWIAYPQNSGICIKPPFAASTSQVSLGSIGTKYDYLNSNPNHANTGVPSSVNKDQGWVLISADFNSNNPYFIIYNKYRSIVRSFFYIYTISPYSTYAITASYDNIGPALLASSNTPPKTLDKYNGTESKDILIKAINASTPNSWIYADFPVQFDPRITNIATSTSQFIIMLYGLNNYNLTVQGSAGAVSPFSQYGDHEMVVNNGSFQSGSHFDASTAGAKVTEIFKAMSELSESADEKETAVQHQDIPAFKTYRSELQIVTNTPTPNPSDNPTTSADNVSKTLSKIGGYVGLIVAVYDLYKAVTVNSVPEDPNASIISALSQFKIALNGTMDITIPLAGNTIKIPGTTGTVGTRSPTKLYDCPIGTINLGKTPAISCSVPFYRSVESYTNPAYANYPTSGYTGRWIKGKLNENIQLIVNKVKDMNKNDLVFQQARYALKFQANQTPNTPNWYSITSDNISTNDIYTFCLPKTQYLPNPIKRDLNNNIYILHRYEQNESHVYGTPYMTPEEFKGVTFEIPEQSTVSFAVIAIYKNMATGQNFTYYENFGVDLVPDPACQSVTQVAGNEEYPCYPYSEFYSNAVSSYLETKQEASCEHRSYNIYSHYNKIIPYYLFLNDAGHTDINVAGSIELLPGFEGLPGFQANIQQPYIYQGGSLNNFEYVYDNCSNSQGFISNGSTYSYREESSLNAEELKIYPNPMDGEINVDLNFIEPKSNIKLSVYNSLGEEVFRDNDISNTNHVIKLKNKVQGLYIFKIESDGNVITRKIIQN